MDPFGPNRLPNRKLSATERFLGVPSHAPPQFHSVAHDELHEDDVVFFSGDYGAEHNNHHNYSTPSSSSSSSSSATPNHNLHHHNHHSNGILAALPENETSRNLRNVSQHFHKASISSISSASSTASSSRAIPRPQPPSQVSSVKFHQSAPVNVPIRSMKARRRHREFDDDEDGEEDEEEDMVPPHEFVARNSAQSPMLAYSVMEGVGRTLKGRDLRQVRNAVWRQTGMKSGMEIGMAIRPKFIGYS